MTTRLRDYTSQVLERIRIELIRLSCKRVRVLPTRVEQSAIQLNYSRKLVLSVAQQFPHL
jgi:hypothetical protein